MSSSYSATINAKYLSLNIQHFTVIKITQQFKELRDISSKTHAWIYIKEL